MMQLILVLSISIKLLNFLQFLRKEWNWHAPIRKKVLLNVDKIKVKVHNFLYEIVYDFVERLPNKAIEEASDIRIAYDVLNPNNDQKNPCYIAKNNFQY